MGLMQGLTKLGESKAGLISVAALAGTAGLLKKTTRPMISAGNEIAFGDPDADKRFLGERGLGVGSIIDAKLGPKVGLGATMLGGGIGTAIGSYAGYATSKALKQATFKKDINIAEKFAKDLPFIGEKKIPLLGGKTLFKAGESGKFGGLIALGAIAGAAIGGTAAIKGYMSRNQDFYEQNPYAKGSAMQASSIGAYGDIVFGMHNSRRG